MTRRRLILVLIIAVAALLAAGWFTAGMTPSWYAPPAATNKQIEQASERLEFRLQEALHKIRPDGASWVLRLSDDVINQWLATRLQSWLRGQKIEWPDGIGVPQVRCRSGVIEVAAPLSDLGDRVGRVDLRPVIEGDTVRLQPGLCGVGRLPLPIPTSLMVSELADLPLVGSPTSALLELIDRRHVRIVSIRPSAGGLDVDLVTLAAPVP
ncbi:MAG: hypothetical protein MK101_01540 [Phycisphaerales bacterium]|nr:hypothetical protein [Phycisphaerales bacterium]